MQHYDEETVKQLKKKLQQEKETLERQLASLSAQDPVNIPSRVDDNAASDTDAAEVEGHDRISAEVGEIEDQLADVITALSRIDDGTYGICLNCAKVIEPARLHALPTATLCIDCEKK